MNERKELAKVLTLILLVCTDLPVWCRHLSTRRGERRSQDDGRNL